MTDPTLNDVKTLLAGDIGGSKTNLAILEPGSGARDVSHVQSFDNDKHPGALDLIQFYLGSIDKKINAICIGIAGPVINNQVQMINLDWFIDGVELAASLQAENVWLINDLQATAQAVPLLMPDELRVLHPGAADADGNIAVIAPGTGIGMGYLTRMGKQLYAFSGEGGHSDFAPTSEMQAELLLYLQERMDHASVEAVASGVGIPNIYSFLRDSGRATEPKWLAEELAAAEDPTPVIVGAALERTGEAPICDQTLEIFVDALGTEAGNLALKIGATGGLYLAGGIPPRILPVLEQDKRFLQAFWRKGNYDKYMQRIPVKVVLNPKAALLGAAAYGAMQLQN